jgi:[ribosomal protein S5]-alanine N-acetyltransferase
MHNNTSTTRLHLNLLCRQDGNFIIQLLNSKGWIEYIGDRNVHTSEEAEAYIDKILGSKNIFYWIVRIKDGSIPIGLVSFIKREYLDHFDIGFAFLPEYSRCGYAYEATKEILSMLSLHPVHNQILATTVPGNKSSINLLTKLGFSFKKEQIVGDQSLHIYTNAVTISTHI